MRDCKAADAVWAATAKLHQDNPNTKAFSSREIYNKVRELGFVNMAKNTIKSNINAYCVAEHPVRPSYRHSRMYRHRKLVKENKKYRLYCRGEYYDPERKDGAMEPEEDPPGCQGFIKWYCDEYCGSKTPSPSSASSTPDPANAQTVRAVTDPQPCHDQASIIAGSKSQTQTGLNKVIKDEPVGIVIFTGKESVPPPKTIEVVTRFVRDTKEVKQIKNLYEDRCQVCRYTIHTPTGRYSEVHHLHPLGEGGNDDNSNMIVLCPTHHVEFDYAVIGISNDGINVVDRNGKTVRKMSIPIKHSLDQKNIKHHLERMRRAGAPRMSRQD